MSKTSVNVIPDRDYQEVLRQRRKNAKITLKQQKRNNNVNSETQRKGSGQNGKRDDSW